MWQKKWIVGNWKMNGSISSNQTLLSALSTLTDNGVYLGVAVPFPYLTQATDFLKDAVCDVGAQDISSFADKGAYTGEVSGRMLKDVGARFVLIGHSERRQYFKENNAILLEKYKRATEDGLCPIFCVGETQEERESGRAEEIISQQLSVFASLNPKNIVVAYEPVWAIGTGLVATPEQIVQMHAFIYKNILSLCSENVSIRILYGGSVNAQNGSSILSLDGVDGALIGGASLKEIEFTDIIRHVGELSV